MRIAVSSCAIAIVLLSVSAAGADEPAAAPPGVHKDEPTVVTMEVVPLPGPATEPYVSPFLLRGVGAGNALQLDTTVAPYTDSKTKLGQTATVSLFSVSARVASELALNVKFGVVRNDHPSAPSSTASTGATNLAFGGMWGTTIADYWRVSASACIAAPIGAGGGSRPDVDNAAAMKAAVLARGGMDNTMFAVNDVPIPLGLDVAYVRRGFTAQVELTVAPMVRARGAQSSPDRSKVNATSGLFFGYFLVPRQFSVGAELRYQRYLSTPDAVAKDSSLRDNLTTGGGVRGYFELASNVSFRPGLSYGTGLEGAVADRHFQMVQVDLPIAF